MSRFRRPNLPIAVVTLIVFVVLCTLGTWQVQRLSWKEDLIAKRVARIDGPMVGAADITDGIEALEYRRLTIVGRFDHQTEMLLSASKRNGVSGTNLVTMMKLQRPGFLAGETLIVDRGFIPLDRRNRETRPETRSAETVELSGWIRKSWPGGLVFTPENDFASGHMLLMDIDGYAAHFDRAVLPFYLQAGPRDASALPLGQKPSVDLPNRHAGYAVTWYGLALVLIGIFAAFHWRRER